MNTKVNKSRRRFFIATGTVAGAMVVGSWWFYRKRDLLSAPPSLTAAEGESIFNAWIKIDDEGRIIVQVPRQEMGQGVVTALPMLVAEELDADLADVHFEQAPIDEVYGNATAFGEGVPFHSDDESWIAEFNRLSQYKVGRVLGLQLTGGSSSVRDAWEPMRQAGATARAMLVAAAAQKFGVAASECEVARSIVTHRASNASASFGELAQAAALLSTPTGAKLKSRGEFKVLGNSQARLDIPEKVDGSATYGIDVRPPGMVYGAIAQSPVMGGTLVSFDRDSVIEMPGVKAIVGLPATSMSQAAVVVVAEHYWQAQKALNAMPLEWDDGEHAAHDTDEQKKRYLAMLGAQGGRVYDVAGDVDEGFDGAEKIVEADYHAPYLAHATMEPMNCTTIARSDGTAEVWVGNQAPTIARWVTAQSLGLESEAVTLHTPYLGGGFGRRSEMDVVQQAALVAKEIPDVPVQLIWSREQDMQHDLYRPMGSGRLRAVLDDAGKLKTFDAKVVGQSCIYGLTARLMPGSESNLMKDRTTTEGIFDLPYGVPNRRTAHVLAEEPVQVGFWRSVGHSHHAFFAESFIDECAIAAGTDPYKFRRAMLEHAPRYRAVLDAVAEKAGWGKSLPANVGRGIAFAESFGSVCAQVAEVELVGQEVRVHRVVCAIDCGFAINPDTVVAQMESGIIYGLTAALFGEITIKQGRVQQLNFPDYRMVQLASSPDIEVHLLESGIEHLGGVGEPGTPPIAPAVCNALYAATGKRVRELPIRV